MTADRLPRTPTVDTPVDTPAAAQPRTTRDPWFDNAKILLVVLVVVGHSWTGLRTTFFTSSLYDFLYLWHVPAFVMVTGYLSRSFTFSRRHLTKLVTTVVVPYLVFELVLTEFRVVVGGETSGLLFLSPHWPMWYLSVLFVWRLATPLLKRVPHPLALSVVVSLVGGAFTGDPLDVARAMGLLPFFVMGLLATPEHLAAIRRPAARVCALGAFAVALVLSPVVQSLGTEWLYWRSSYAQLHASLLGGMATRAVLLAAAAALSVSFFALLSRRGGWFSRMGAASLVVYLFHGFFIKLASYSAYPGWAREHAGLAMLISTVVAVAVALVLAAPPVAQRLNVFVDPFGTWSRSRQRRQEG